MIVTESRRTRHLVVRLQRDEELPGALQRTLDEVEATSGWITGLGALDAAELAVIDPLGGPLRVRRIEGRCNVVSLTGNLATRDGAGSVRLTVTLARETDLGQEICGGELVWARAFGLELLVTAFEDAQLARIDDSRTGGATLAAATPRPLPAQPARPDPSPTEPARAAAARLDPTPHAAEPPRTPSPVRPEPPPRPADPVRELPAPPRAEPPPEPARVEPARPPAPVTTVEMHTPPTPLRRRAREDSTEVYPEVGDRATHFHFGECTIIASDGERIRLRQERDGRVREVSLEMLKIEPPTADPATGQKTFLLSRKH